jgi:tryptophan-rich sensory protein
MNKLASDIFKLTAALILCFLAAYLGQVFTGPAIPTWYAGLHKPIFSPPNWLFGPVWTLLYALMAVSAFLVWREDGKDQEIKLALKIFVIQLILNILWSLAFFGLRSPLLGLIVIVALWAAILLTIKNFLRISALAGWLMLPYLLWVSFASVLNFSIFILNL